ncbi:MAG: amidohydrolase family protein [Sphingopyxis sp.]|uniref:amidohydrolase family protein n=1 Tax=Sphingopyxis sp. TaxID=1908224 RepID=UPI002AB96D65|nr:amidohydrolase family protein [Sphingopyxis sp.]MDZ3832461.1 amidohydrolase family protein [Sphingopyxis sp.]
MTKALVLFLAAGLLPAAASAREAAFDTHVHLHRDDTSLRKYQAQLAAAGIELSGFAAMWFGGPNQAKAGDPDAIRAGNDGIIALARKHPGMIPVATVHPYDGDAALDELARVAAGGVRILKIHPHTQQFDASDPRVAALARRAGELDMIVLLDNANILPGDSEKLFNLAVGNPKTRFIMAHMGAMNFRFWNILKAARDAEDSSGDNIRVGDNIFFDLSVTVTLAAGSPVADEFVWTLRNVGIDQVLLGSDYPQYSLAANIAALDRLPLTATEKQKILRDNAARLFGKPGPQRN